MVRIGLRPVVVVAVATLFACTMVPNVAAGAASPTISVTPSTGLTDGQTVHVSGSGFTATPLVNDWAISECRASIITDGITLNNALADCDATTTPFVFVHADASGNIATPFAVRQSFVTSGGGRSVTCSVTEGCALLVAQVTNEGFVGAAAPISFGSPATSIRDCIRGGWRTHTRADGRRFRSMAECVLYVVFRRIATRHP